MKVLWFTVIEFQDIAIPVEGVGLATNYQACWGLAATILGSTTGMVYLLLLLKPPSPPFLVSSDLYNPERRQQSREGLLFGSKPSSYRRHPNREENLIAPFLNHNQVPLLL